MNLGWLANMATEFINTLKTAGGDYSSLPTWEADIDGYNYTAATTKVFSHGGITGTVSAGDTVTGQTSGATATVCAAVTGTQILLGSISGTFSSGEVVQVSAGNSVTISDVGDSAIVVLEGYTGTFTGLVVISGATTSSTNKIIIRSASGHGHGGQIDTGFKINSTTVQQTTFNVGTSNVELRDFVIACEATVGNYSTALQITTSGSSASNMIISASQQGVVNNATLDNCLVYCNGLHATPAQGINTTDQRYANAVARNCTVSGFLIGYANWYVPWARSPQTLKNCVAYNNTSSLNDATDGHVNSITNADDTGEVVSAGIGSISSVSSSDFVDSANDDYHLVSGSALIGAGTDLSGSFTTDIDGDTRSSWDIGFDEFVSAGGGGTASPIDSTHAHSSDTLSVTQTHSAVLAGSTHAHSSDALTATQVHVAALSQSTHTHTSGTLLVEQLATAALLDSAHGHTSDALSVTQTHSATLLQSTHAHSSDTLSVVSDGSATAVLLDSIHAHGSDVLSVTQTHTVSLSQSTHPHTSDTLSVSELVTALLLGSTHSHTSDILTVTQSHAAALIEAIHSHGSDTITVSQIHSAILLQSTHAHGSDTLTLGGLDAPVTPTSRVHAVAAENRVHAIAAESRTHTIN